MKTQLLVMLELQNAMNGRVHAHWRQQDFAWYRAIWTECAELLDHYGWKWWKKQSPDIDQVKLELVDIWHFGLSILLLSETTTETLADHIVSRLHVTAGTGDFRLTLEQFTLETLKTREFDVPLFAALMAEAEMDFNELYVRYVGKNVLNFFRQDHGYQEGTYRKQWGQKEDNEHLVEVVSALDPDDPAFKDHVYKALAERYQQPTE